MEKSQRGRDALDLGATIAIWAAAIALVQPRGNFPINDDWDFAIATWRFAETGHFHFTPFTAVSLRAQVVWGAAWTRLFGESFNVLRASTILLAALLIGVVYFSLRRAGVERVPRLLGTLAFAFHPIFFWSSCTYMTEVPFVFTSTIALLLFFCALTDDHLGLLFAACAVAVVSWFVRQTGITNLFAPLAFLLILRARLTPRWKKFAAVIGCFMLLFVVLLIFKRDWLSGSPSEFANHFKMWTEETFRTPEQLAIFEHYTFFNAQNAALCFLPLSAGLLFAFPKRKRWEWGVLIFVALVVVACIREQIERHDPLPYANTRYSCCNTIVNWGLGQQTLSDIWRSKLPYPVHLTMSARVGLTWVSGVIAILLLLQVIVAVIRDERLFVRLTAGMTIAGTMALFGSGLYTDRYSFDATWAAGLMLPLVIPWNRRTVRVVVAALIVAVAVFDVLAVQEYFAWNRARWTAIDALRSKGVPIEQIDGGAEPFNFYELPTMNQQQRRRATIRFLPRKYMLTFQPVAGYEVIDKQPFHGWLAVHDGAIYTLRQLPSS